MKRLIVVVYGHWTCRMVNVYVYSDKSGAFFTLVKDMPFFFYLTQCRTVQSYKYFLVREYNLDMPNGIMMNGAKFQRFLPPFQGMFSMKK